MPSVQICETIGEVERRRFEQRCPECGKVPEIVSRSHYKCTCGQQWERLLGVEGVEDDQKLLAGSGFVLEKDIQGGVCYVRNGHTVWLYADGNWCGDGAGGKTLDEYLSDIQKQIDTLLLGQTPPEM